MELKAQTEYSHFEALDIRVGRIVDIQDATTKKPTYRMTIDFGPVIGRYVSCGAYRNYPKEELLGKEVVCVINLGEKKMGPEVSQVLVLGVPGQNGETIRLMPQSDVDLGVQVF